jgi:hypothetical protein
MFRSLKRSMVALSAFAAIAITSGGAVAAPLLLEEVESPSTTEANADERLEARSKIVTRVQLLPENRQKLAEIRMEFEVFIHDDDMRGIEDSRYTGRFFQPHVEDQRKCIVKRESGGRYDVVSAGGGYFGAYQMSPDLGRGVTWMMLPEHKELLGADRAKELLADLRTRPVNTWPRYWQDAAFSTIYNWEGDASGARHWNATRFGC